MEVPRPADAETEAFFTHEGGSPVFDRGAGRGAVPVQRGGEGPGVDLLFGIVRALGLEVINGPGGNGEVGGFGSGVPSPAACMAFSDRSVWVRMSRALLGGSCKKAASLRFQKVESGAGMGSGKGWGQH
jgi:hypothetical protein